MANTFLQVVENDLKTAWVDTENFVDNDAILAWNTIKVIFEAMLPGQYNILIGLLSTFETDILAGQTIENIEQLLVEAAEGQELTWVVTLGSGILQGLIALFKAQVVTTPVVVANTTPAA